MRKRFAVALPSLVLLWAMSVRADEPATQFPEVVVTATRTRTRTEDSTASVSVINGTEVTQRDQAMVGDALRGAPE